jgi:hypothetical protein
MNTLLNKSRLKIKQNNVANTLLAKREYELFSVLKLNQFYMELIASIA